MSEELKASKIIWKHIHRIRKLQKYNKSYYDACDGSIPIGNLWEIDYLKETINILFKQRHTDKRIEQLEKQLEEMSELVIEYASEVWGYNQWRQNTTKKNKRFLDQIKSDINKAELADLKDELKTAEDTINELTIQIIGDEDEQCDCCEHDPTIEPYKRIEQLEQQLKQIKELVDANDYRYSKAGLLQEEIQQILEGEK